MARAQASAKLTRWAELMSKPCNQTCRICDQIFCCCPFKSCVLLHLYIGILVLQYYANITNHASSWYVGMTQKYKWPPQSIFYA